MTESIQKVIKRLRKFNQAYFNSYLDKCVIIRYETLGDLGDIFLLKNNQVITINPDGTQVSEFENFDKFNQYLGNAVADAFVIDFANGHIENRYKSPLKNNTLWFSNHKIDEIIMKYVMCYIVANDLLGDMSIEYLKSIKIPIINCNDQEILARKFGKQYKVVTYLENQAKLEQERIMLEQENSAKWQTMLRKF
jgi:hypothetical protein